MTKETRQMVYEKYNGHCAYCGREIKIQDMQVDHIIPLRTWNGGHEIDELEKYNPSCRRCNHYKRAHSLETFREMLTTLQDRIMLNYICKVGEDYGIVEIHKWDGKFYFERGGEV
jgi:5-methylcytosine-specific restriction endonuclease McrA